MAGLPPDGTWLMQQIDGQVVLFHRYTEEEIVRFDPADANQTAIAQKTIHDAPELTDEQKNFAHFWSGYFYAHTSPRAEVETAEATIARVEALAEEEDLADLLAAGSDPLIHWSSVRKALDRPAPGTEPS